MYKDFFGFRKDPFASTPDPAFFFRSHHHDAALNGLQLSIEARMGVVSLLGDEGTGKTVVLQCLRNSLGADVPCAFLSDSRICLSQFLETVASDLNLDLRSNSAHHVLLAITRLMTEQARRGGTVVLIVDQAHNLQPNVFEEIVHLASLHQGKAKEIQTVFAGRPGLQQRLADLNPDGVKQRALLIRSLYPFTSRETQEYIEFRMACAGVAQQTIFPRKALESIHDEAQGYAPRIHALCGKLLLTAFAAGSRVCTREVCDQVLKKPRRLGKIVEDARSVVAARLDRLRLLSPPEPQPPPMQTVLLRVTVDPRRGPMKPSPVSTEGHSIHFGATAIKVQTPRLNLALGGAELLLGSGRPMSLQDCIKPLALMSMSSREPGPVRRKKRPVHFDATAIKVQSPSWKSALDGAEFPLGLSRPMSLEDCIKPSALMSMSARESRPVSRKKRPVRFCGTTIKVQFPSWKSALDGAGFPLGLSRPMSLGDCIKPSALAHARDPGPAASSISAGEEFRHLAGSADAAASKPGALQLQACKLIPSIGYLKIAAKLNGGPSLESVAPEPFSGAVQTSNRTRGFQPAGVILCSTVTLPAFQAARHDQPPPGGAQLINGQAVGFTVGRPTVKFPWAPLRPSLQTTSLPVQLPFNARPSPAARAMRNHLISTVWPLPHAWRPVSGLKPAAYRRRPLLPPANGMTQDANPQLSRSFALLRKPLVTLLSAVVSALALNCAIPALRVGADSSRQAWHRAQHTVLDRAAVTLDEDFRGGLRNWMGRSGSPPPWRADASAFVHPGALALYRPSRGMVDYQMQFLGTIDKHNLSWVVRAADFNNYYAVRLEVLKPGPLPAIGVTRYAVIQGIPQKHVTTALFMRAQADTVYRVRLDVQGDQFALSVQDQPVDSWSESRLGHGAIGFFSEGEGSRVAALQLRCHDDALGRLYAFLIPFTMPGDR